MFWTNSVVTAGQMVSQLLQVHTHKQRGHSWTNGQPAPTSSYTHSMVTAGQMVSQLLQVHTHTNSMVTAGQMVSQLLQVHTHKQHGHSWTNGQPAPTSSYTHSVVTAGQMVSQLLQVHTHKQHGHSWTNGQPAPTSSHTHTAWYNNALLNLPWNQMCTNKNKLAPYGTAGRLLLTANFKVTWHKD